MANNGWEDEEELGDWDFVYKPSDHFGIIRFRASPAGPTMLEEFGFILLIRLYGITKEEAGDLCLVLRDFHFSLRTVIMMDAVKQKMNEFRQ